MVDGAFDGYKILTYLQGRKTAEVKCDSRHEAHYLLTALTQESTGALSADALGIPEENLPSDYDKAELWFEDELIAFGLRKDPPL
jgi:hypothetical protein